MSEELLTIVETDLGLCPLCAVAHIVVVRMDKNGQTVIVIKCRGCDAFASTVVRGCWLDELPEIGKSYGSSVSEIAIFYDQSPLAAKRVTKWLIEMKEREHENSKRSKRNQRTTDKVGAATDRKTEKGGKTDKSSSDNL